MKTLPRLALFSFAAVATLARLSAADTALPVKLTKLDDRIRVEVGGQPFTEYVFGDGASRPYCYPILAPDGTGLTRDFPQKNTPVASATNPNGEEHDHPWHRSLYFAHSYMNNVDFWNEAGGDKGKSPDAKGHQVQDALVEVKSGKVGSLHTRSRWLDPKGVLICTDDRVLRFGGDADSRYIDYEITLHALPDKPLLMGDNKDGTMAIRVAEWMTMKRKARGGGDVGGNGHIVEAKGARDDAVFAKRSEWATYFAEHNGKTYGISIFENPENFRFPSWWMARGYGLFGKNPFGQHDYEDSKANPVPEGKGNHEIPAGGSLTLKYRFYFHYGDEQAAKVAEHYAAYAGKK
jgi:hypothetical protein